MEYMLGEIVLFTFDFAPRGFMECKGSILPISQYSALFSLLGTKFGGDGTTTFALPNLTGKEPAPGLHYCICSEGVYPTRQ